jgi:hypothetical protein
MGQLGRFPISENPDPFRRYSLPVPAQSRRSASPPA